MFIGTSIASLPPSPFYQIQPMATAILWNDVNHHHRAKYDSEHCIPYHDHHVNDNNYHHVNDDNNKKIMLTTS